MFIENTILPNHDFHFSEKFVDQIFRNLLDAAPGRILQHISDVKRVSKSHGGILFRRNAVLGEKEIVLSKELYDQKYQISKRNESYGKNAHLYVR